MAARTFCTHAFGKELNGEGQVNNPPKIAVIVVTFNGEKWINRCLGSLLSSTFIPYVIVIDNASSDATAELISAFPGVELIQSASNLGFGSANNIGLNRAIAIGAEYAMLLNQDAYVEADAIEKLIGTSSKLPSDIGLITPLHLSYEGDEIEHQFLKHYLARQQLPFFSDLLFNSLKEFYVPLASNAAAWLIPRSTLLKVGGFDPLFFMYGEDDDYRARVDYHQLKTALIPGARIRHWSGHRTRVASPQKPSISKRANRIYSNCVREIKDPRLSYKLGLFRGLTTTFSNGLSALLFKRDIREALATYIALSKAIYRIPKIISHKKMTRSRGAFLDNPL